jgi:5'-methylthioinosine phosphorylase
MLAIIGGSGLSALAPYRLLSEQPVATDFGSQPVLVRRYAEQSSGSELLFINRHGEGHQLPPHRINYRSNLAALKLQGATDIVAINSVGGIHDKLAPGSFAVPDQLIDYSWGRESTFFHGEANSFSAAQERFGEAHVVHAEFGQPTDVVLNGQLIQAFKRAAKQGAEQEAWQGLGAYQLLETGCYGVTQGPRLETHAEVVRMRRDGCDMVGMTAMPEACLARELGLRYSILALSVNWAAGLGAAAITLDEIRQIIAAGGAAIQSIIDELLRQRSLGPGDRV